MESQCINIDRDFIILGFAFLNIIPILNHVLIMLKCFIF